MSTIERLVKSNSTIDSVVSYRKLMCVTYHLLTTSSVFTTNDVYFERLQRAIFFVEDSVMLFYIGKNNGSLEIAS